MSSIQPLRSSNISGCVKQASDPEYVGRGALSLGILGLVCAVARLATPSRGRGANALPGSDLYGWLGVISRLGSHTFLDVPGHLEEGLLNIRSTLGRCLEPRDIKAIGEFLQVAEITQG